MPESINFFFLEFQVWWVETNFIFLLLLITKWCKVHFFPLDSHTNLIKYLLSTSTSSLASSCDSRRFLLSFASLRTFYIYEDMQCGVFRESYYMWNYVTVCTLKRLKGHVWVTKTDFFFIRRSFKKQTKKEKRKYKTPGNIPMELLWLGLARLIWEVHTRYI